MSIEGRVLAIDYGEKRIGIAMSDPLGMTAQTHPYLSNLPDWKTKLKALCDQYSVHTVLLGLPIAMSGSETTKSQEVRLLAEELGPFLSLPIFLRDERLSTRAVTQRMISADLRRDKRKELVDSQAAAFFLQGYLDEVSRKKTPPHD